MISGACFEQEKSTGNVCKKCGIAEGSMRYSKRYRGWICNDAMMCKVRRTEQ